MSEATPPCAKPRSRLVTNPNVAKTVYLGKHLGITADCIGLYLGHPDKPNAEVEAFADSLPGVICYEGAIGLRAAFAEWKKGKKTKKTK